MKKKITVINIFGEFFTNHFKYFVYLFFILVFEGLVTSISIVSIAPLADFLIDDKLESPSSITLNFIKVIEFLGFEKGLIVFSILFIISNFIKGIFEIFIRYSVLLIKYRVQREIISELLSNFLRAKWSFFSNEKKGKLLNSFNRELSVVGDTLGHLTMQFAMGIQLLIYLVIPIWLNPKMTITAIFIALIASLPFLALHKLSYKLGTQNTKTANIVMSVLSDIFNGIRIIIGYAKQDKTLKLYQNSFDNHVDAAIKSQTLSQSIQSIYQPIGITAAISALILAVSSGVKIAEASIILWSLFRAMPIIGLLLRTNLSISNFIPSYEQLLIMKERSINERESEGKVRFEGLKNTIAFDKVSFSYQDRDQTINELCIEFKKNKITAIVGESGSGKSTIIDILLGFQSPSKGKIYFDETELCYLDVNSFRNKIGYVPQEPFLFSGSIKDNLLWAIEDLGESEEEIKSVIKRVGLDNLIDTLPKGIDTEIGDNAVKLSGGQKQRLALARALIRKPEIIILDEATSSLDSETENQIQKTLGALDGKTTLIIIAHRLSTIVNADIIYVIKKGR